MEIDPILSEPPLKKQKIEHVAVEPLPRVRKAPETIDLPTILSGPVTSKEQQRRLDSLLKVFRKKKKVVVVAGAGISVGAGSTCTARNPLLTRPIMHACQW